MASDEPRERLPADWPERSPGGFAAERDQVLADVRNVQFPTAMRGYERDAVDDYVVRVNRLIAELESSRSPESAVKRALERVGEETSGILQRAQEASEEMARRSRAAADDRVQSAEREAREMRAAAEARVAELERELDKLWEERSRLIADAARAAEALSRVAHEAGERIPDPRAARAERTETAQLEAVSVGSEPAEADEGAFPADDRGLPDDRDAVPPDEEPFGAGEPHATHPEELEPEPPDRLTPGEGVLRVEPMRRDEPGGPPSPDGRP